MDVLILVLALKGNFCMLHVATACSSVTSDTTEHCVSKTGFEVIDLSKNVEDKKAEEEDWKKVSNQAVIFQNLLIVIIMLWQQHC
jgi:Na+/pantothenate symporter